MKKEYSQFKQLLSKIDNNSQLEEISSFLDFREIHNKYYQNRNRSNTLYSRYLNNIFYLEFMYEKGNLKLKLTKYSDESSDCVNDNSIYGCVYFTINHDQLEFSYKDNGIFITEFKDIIVKELDKILPIVHSDITNYMVESKFCNILDFKSLFLALDYQFKKTDKDFQLLYDSILPHIQVYANKHQTIEFTILKGDKDWTENHARLFVRKDGLDLYLQGSMDVMDYFNQIIEEYNIDEEIYKKMNKLLKETCE